MAETIQPAPDEHVGTEKVPYDPNASAADPYDASLERILLPLSRFSWWAVGSVLLGCTAVSVHLLLWWNQGGIIERDLIFPDQVSIAIVGCHFVCGLGGLIFAVKGLYRRTGNRWLSWVALFLAVVVFLGGIVFLRTAWVHIVSEKFP
jgi:hypothetical protein